MKLGLGLGLAYTQFSNSNNTSAPTNSVLPTITGTPQEGQTLTCSTGTWTGSPTFTYQWINSSTGNISGATSSTYTPQATDIGDTLTCNVTATNTAGSASAMSNATGTVVAAPVIGVYFAPSYFMPTYFTRGYFGPYFSMGDPPGPTEVLGIPDGSQFGIPTAP